MSSTPDGSPSREPLVDSGFLDWTSEANAPADKTEANRFSVKLATDVTGVEALRTLWRTWTNSLDTDVDFFLHQLSQDSKALAPYVICVYDEGIAQAMLVGQIRKQKASAVVSFVNVPGPTMRVLEIKKGGRLGRESQEVDKVLAMELLKAIRSGEIDSICLDRLPLHCELFRQIQQLPGFFVKERVPHIFCYSELNLSDPEKKHPQVFWGKTLREMRRKTRIVEQAFPGQVNVKCFSQPTELDIGMDEAMRVARTTWQHSLGQGFQDKEQRETYQFFAEQGWLRIYVLYIKDVPCAFLAGQLYRNSFYCQFTGYRPEYGRYSVGAVLTAHAFEELAAAGVQRVDLGEGGQEHNRRMGCQMVEEGTVHIYSPTLRGVWLNLFFGTTQIVRQGGRRVRSTLRLDRLERAWRQYRVSRRLSRYRASYASSARKSI
jgi:GNAT acetyltransferase-like protein